MNADKKPLFDAYIFALKELDVQEIEGKEHNERIIEYHSKTTLRATEDEIPWCSSFVCWCLEKAAISHTRSARARSYLTWGREILPTDAQIGDIVVLSRNVQNDAEAGHVGFVHFIDQHQLLVLGGNQKNKVGVNFYNRKRVLSIRRI